MYIAYLYIGELCVCPVSVMIAVTCVQYACCSCIDEAPIAQYAIQRGTGVIRCEADNNVALD